MSGPRGPIPPPGSREDILSHLLTLLGSVSGIAEAARNRGDFTKLQLPALILFDGGHELAQEIQPSKFVSMPAARFTLKPGIVLIAESRDTPSNLTLNGNAVPIGPELSAWEDKITTTIETDQTLLSLLTPTGQIVYRGSDTDMQWGGSLQGGLQLNYEFTYVRVQP